MASSASSTLLSEEDFYGLVKMGRKLVGYLFNDAEFIDTNETFERTSKTCQTNTLWWDSYAYQWKQNIETGQAPKLLQPLARAITSITVGRNDPNLEPYERARTIDANVTPWGRNIPITLINSVSAILTEQ